MVKRTGPSNIHLLELVSDLKKQAIEQQTKLWKRIAKELERPTRERREVNLSRINRYAKQGETIIIPGKVLGSGEIEKKVDISAFSFSKSAEEKIKKAGGKVTTIKELLKNNPKAEKVRILG